MSEKDKLWIEKCIKQPDEYKMFVDNDCVFVCCKNDGYDSVRWTFDEYGYFFAEQLLEYLGCNVEFV